MNSLITRVCIQLLGSRTISVDAKLIIVVTRTSTMSRRFGDVPRRSRLGRSLSHRDFDDVWSLTSILPCILDYDRLLTQSKFDPISALVPISLSISSVAIQEDFDILVDTTSRMIRVFLLARINLSKRQYRFVAQKTFSNSTL